VAFQYLLAGRAEPRAVLLQAGLNRAVVSQILPAEALGIARASILFLRRAGMLRSANGTFVTSSVRTRESLIIAHLMSVSWSSLEETRSASEGSANECFRAACKARLKPLTRAA